MGELIYVSWLKVDMNLNILFTFPSQRSNFNRFKIFNQNNVRESLLTGGFSFYLKVVDPILDPM